MSPKPKVPVSESKPYKPKVSFYAGRDGLGAYTAEPSAFGPERMIYFNDDFAVINDLYPKSTVHTLVLPRHERNALHPFDAFEDPVFLESVKQETAKVKVLVASELRRRFGRFSASDKPRIEAMEADEVPHELPTGRDWSKDVISGIHAHPSMNHLHVHVMSRDMVNNCMTHRRHYESFCTAFLVPLEAFPLAQDDPRRHPGRSGIINQDLGCWRCGSNFGNKFTKLKAHLDEEFDAWKRQ